MEMLAISQSSLLQPQLRFRFRTKKIISSTTVTSSNTRRPSSLTLSADFASSPPDYKSLLTSRVRPGIGIVSDSKAPTLIIESSATEAEGFDIKPSTTDGDGFGGGEGGDSGGGGGGDNNNNNEGDEGSEESKGKKMAMSMSQKLTLGYAALVGLGGVMGYLKSGSQKSLLAGGISASLLYYVFTELPVRPTFASAIGLGLSAALLGVMGSRFKKSGKIFPAGVVSLVSFIMTGGYLHGIMRGMH